VRRNPTLPHSCPPKVTFVGVPQRLIRGLESALERVMLEQYQIGIPKLEKEKNLFGRAIPYSEE
jgi:hypothetical protein